MFALRCDCATTIVITVSPRKLTLVFLNLSRVVNSVRRRLGRDDATRVSQLRFISVSALSGDGKASSIPGDAVSVVVVLWSMEVSLGTMIIVYFVDDRTPTVAGGFVETIEVWSVESVWVPRLGRNLVSLNWLP